MTTRVVITAAELARWKHDVTIGIESVNRLKKMYVPVIGAIAPLGVQRGTLAVHTEPNGDRIYTYTQPDNDEDEL